MDANNEPPTTTVVYAGISGGAAQQVDSWFEASPRNISLVHTDYDALPEAAGRADCVVIFDQEIDPVTATERIRRRHPNTPIISFCENGTKETAQRIHRLNATYLHRGIGEDEFETLAQHIDRLAVTTDCNINTNPFPTVLIDGNTIIDVNQHFVDLVGNDSKEAFTGKPFDSIVAFEDDQHEESCVTNDRALPAEIKYRFGNGRPVRIRMMNVGENRYQIVFEDRGSVDDLLERVDAVAMASRSMLTPDAPEMVCDITIDVAENILDLSTAGVWMYDVREDELELTANIGDVDSIVPNEDNESLMDIFEEGKSKVISLNRNGMQENRAAFTPIGRHGLLAVGASEASMNDGVLGGLLNLLGRFGESAIERAKRVSDVQDLEQDLRKYEQRTDVIGSMLSREVRHSLDVIRNRISNGELDEEELLECIEQTNDSVQEAIRLSRHGRPIGQREVVDLTEEIESAWEAVRTPEATLIIDEDMGDINADRDRLVEMLECILDIALTYGGEDANIGIGADTDGFHIEVDGHDLFNGITKNSIEGDASVSQVVAENIAKAHGWSFDAVNDGEKARLVVSHCR